VLRFPGTPIITPGWCGDSVGNPTDFRPDRIYKRTGSINPRPWSAISDARAVPRCSATIHLKDPQDAPQIVKCWMCRATTDTSHLDPAPKTIRASSSDWRENPDPVALRINSSVKAANLELSRTERIRLEIVFALAQRTEFEITKSLTVIGRKGARPTSKLMTRRSPVPIAPSNSDETESFSTTCSRRTEPIFAVLWSRLFDCRRCRFFASEHRTCASRQIARVSVNGWLER
jgi:hypothetical protein